jgi:uncharacterized protein (DUF1800 family)
MTFDFLARIAAVALASLLLASCNGQGDSQTEGPSASSGQVVPAQAAGAVSYYAASRFADQTTFGATPALVEAIRTKGFEVWINEQFALPASTVNVTPLLGFVDPVPDADNIYYSKAFPNLAIAAADQLRLRVTWSLSQFIVASQAKVDMVGMVYWMNLLQQHGLGKYGDLLYEVSVSPAMGVYLDNNQNRPKSAECPHCAPNENYARELMQLFSLGVMKLQPDGTPIKDSNGRFIETYTQRDVEELARVLTGWQTDPSPQNRPTRNYGNWAKPMIATTWPPERDSGAKTVLGQLFPAGRTQVQDLRDAIDLLMGHANIAPFVATRMIQHLVKSNPTPAYVGRVAAKFKNNGSGVVGDMKAVVKAVLLDAEARAGDVPGQVGPNDGKLREPFLHVTALWRGLGCAQFPMQSWGVALPPLQAPFNAPSVFSYYAPTDRAPGSNLLAPEQKLMVSTEFISRMSGSSSHLWELNSASTQRLVAAGCAVDPLVQAYVSNPTEFINRLGQLYFRGAVPPLVRADIELQIRQPNWDTQQPFRGAFAMVDYALSTPFFGVIK